MIENAQGLKTNFASPQRSDGKEINESRRLVEEAGLTTPVVKETLDSILDMLLLLDENRQAVLANERLFKFLQFDDDGPILGKRPGEIFGCMYADMEEAGCGTSKFCRSCGAVHAILDAQHGKHMIQECRLLQKSGNAIDLAVSTVPIEIKGRRFVLFAIADISDHKRREVLERIFFHDILNVSNIITMLSGLLKGGRTEKVAEYSEKLERATKRLAEEINSHRDFTMAERGELELHPKLLVVRDVIEDTAGIFSELEVARGRAIVVKCAMGDAVLTTDPVLLRRVLGNMIKNALEATPVGGEVQIGCGQEDGRVLFWVHNDGAMSEGVQLEIFKRSFSTKEKGRGLGTYSMKFLGERYLGGEVSFTSNAENGTTFTLSLPEKG
jgi:signal transduction histidine kinase